MNIDNNTQKEEKDTTNINNNISSIPIHSSEGGRISADSKEDQEYSDDDFSSKGIKSLKSYNTTSNINIQDETPMFIFKVKKLGKKGITHKSRLLIITPEGISYYQMVEKNEKTQNFLNLLKSLYRVIKNNDFDRVIFNKMIQAFKALPQKEKIHKQTFKHYEIEDLAEYDSFKKAPIRIENLDVKNEQERSNPHNFWIMETNYDFFRKAINDAKKTCDDYGKDSEKNLDNNGENSTTKLTTNIIINKKGEGELDIEKETKTLFDNKDVTDIQFEKKIKNKSKLKQEKEKIHFIGIFFQAFIKEYYEHINFCNKQKIIQMDNNKKKEGEEKNLEEEKKRNDIKKKLYLELAIYYCYNMFVKHCEKVVMKIVSDLSTFKTSRDILKPGILHPIVFPNPFSLTQENNAVFLYSIWGVNYTLTWNSLKGKFNSVVTKSQGKWKGLKNLYKQKNCFQDLLTKISTVCSNINKFPCIPLNCMIDYNGFRVYCESEIFAGEDNSECSDRFEYEMNNFIRELAKNICENNNKIKKNFGEENNYCCITNGNLSKEKAIDFESGLEEILNDFLESFPKREGDNKQDLKFYKSEEQMINLVKNIISDIPVKENFTETFSIKEESIKKKLNKDYTYYYLFNFDLSVPILNNGISMKNRDGKIFYRKEIFINNINFAHYEKLIKDQYDMNNVFINDDNNLENEEEVENSQPSHLQMEESDEYLYEEEDSEEKSLKENENEKIKNEISEENREEEEKQNERFLEIITKNTYQNNPSIEVELSNQFKINFENLLISLDSLYLIPYNSETLKMCFHYFGINLCYLGKVAERTTIPHIRELCLIDMFARVSKKIIFDLLAQNTFERATNAFYSNVKKIFLNKHLIPFSYKVTYGGDYLAMSTLPIEDVKFLFYDGVELKGLYLQSDEYPFKELDESSLNNSMELNEDRYEINYDNKNENVLNFFNLLFGNGLLNNNNKLILYGTEINNTKELWDFIIEQIREQYNIIDEDVFIYCNLDSISVLPLLSAIQYHTGIRFKNESGSIFDKVVNHKYSRTIFDEFLLSPKISYNSFSYFLCKENTILPLRNNFGMFYPGRKIYYQAKLNYHAEQYLFKKKISQNYFYLFYLKILKGWDTDETKKIQRGDNYNNIKKEFNKNIVKNSISQDQIASLFEDNFDTFIILILSQYRSKNQKTDKIFNQSVEKLDINNLLNVCERIISINWGNKHPFMCILYSTFAKALYKNIKNIINKDNEKNINTFFFKATNIARDALGELNIFYGKLTRDIGLFYEKNLIYQEAHKMFYLANKVYDKHKIRFKIEYFYTLKHLAKNCINLGQFKEGLDYGFRLVKEIVNEIPTLLDLTKGGEDINNLNLENEEEYNKKYECYFWDHIHNMDGFTFNLVQVAKYLCEYDTGVKLGNILFKIISKKSKNSVDYKFYNYNNWLEFLDKRINDLNNLKNNQNNNKKDSESNNDIRLKDYGTNKIEIIDNFIELYLECLFRGLHGIDNKVLARAYIGFIENCNEPSLVNASRDEIDKKFYKIFFRDNGETFEEHFRNKILYFLYQKYKAGGVNSIEIQDNYNISKKEMQVIYFKFQNLFKIFLFDIFNV